MRESTRMRGLLGVILVVGILVAIWSLPLDQWLDSAGAWTEEKPLAGRAIFIAAFIAGSILMLPGSLLCMSGGYLFGLYGGVPLVSIGSAIGAAGACAISRRFARGWLHRRFDGDARFHAIDRAIESKAFTIVVLTRLSLLIPFNVLNMLYGLTRVPVSTLALGTWVGMLPAVVLYVYVGSIARNVDQLLSGELQTGLAGKLLFVAGLVAVIVATFVIHRTATRELRRELDNAELDPAREEFGD